MPKNRRQCTIGNDEAERSGSVEAPRTDRGQRVTVDRAQIDRAARAAAGVEDVQPRRSCEWRGPDCGRSQHVPARCEPPIPAFDHCLGFGARPGQP
jgi:hypothetical protein